MDAKELQLKEKFDNLLMQTCAVAAELQALQQGDGIPHFDDIELSAHDAGQRLSRAIQGERAREVAMRELKGTRCPDCKQQCRVEIEVRNVHSMDGPIELTEPVAKCRRCRRSFFPSANRTRV